LIETLRPELLWKSANQMAAEAVASSMTGDQVNVIVDGIKAHGLMVENHDDLWTNFTLVGGWFSRNRQEITSSNVGKAVGNVQNSINGYKLRWAKKLQPYEVEAERRKAEAATAPAQREELLDLSRPQLPPHLRAHREMLHRTEPETKPTNHSGEWKQLAEDVLQNTRSHVVQERARKLLFAFNGVVDWQATYHARRRLIEQSGVR